jgi:hypothetical protein
MNLTMPSAPSESSFRECTHVPCTAPANPALTRPLGVKSGLFRGCDSKIRSANTTNRIRDSNSHSCLSLQSADFEVKQGKWMIASSKQKTNVSAYLKPIVPKVEPILCTNLSFKALHLHLKAPSVCNSFVEDCVCHGVAPANLNSGCCQFHNWK